MTDTIRVLIADDHTVVRKGIRTLLMTEPGLEVVGEAGDGAEAIQQFRALQPDVLLLDMQMPVRNGVEVINELKQTFPEARILILTSFSEDETVFTAIKAGAMGYLLKDSSPEELIQAIRDVYQGRPSLQPTIAYKLMQELNRPRRELPPTEEPLTEREVEILKLVAQGLSNQAIADRLVISERTARTHISHILDKLHLANRTQAALYALRQGIASLDENED
ncbi:MAG TPA: response regulator transcription factor [Anaerolineae bacterium]